MRRSIDERDTHGRPRRAMRWPHAWRWLALLAGWVVVTVAAAAAAATAAGGIEDRAVEIFRSLAAGDARPYEQAASPQVLASLDGARLKAVFADLQRQTGALVSTGTPTSTPRGGYVQVEVPLQYERALQVGRVVFDGDGRIVGVQIRPAAPPGEFHSASYVDSSRFTAEPVVVDAGGWPLPGTLTMPNGPGPFAALVLVHGSGPNDRDESLGPNKMFRDIAEGLASRGIAVLRYEKRSREHAARLSSDTSLTPREEVIDDALAAIRLLRHNSKLQANAVFLAGHSFGGTLAPAIAARDGQLAGVILLAAGIRPIEDTIVSQTRYLAQLDGQVTADEARQIAQAEQLARDVRTLQKPSDPPPRSAIASAPTAYWLALRELEPKLTASGLKAPTLVLQGERDYQVTLDDFAAWKALLARHERTEFRSFPRLNHAFMPGDGASSPAEYSVPNHVDAGVIDAIADWVRIVAASPGLRGGLRSSRSLASLRPREFEQWPEVAVICCNEGDVELALRRDALDLEPTKILLAERGRAGSVCADQRHSSRGRRSSSRASSAMRSWSSWSLGPWDSSFIDRATGATRSLASWWARAEIDSRILVRGTIA